MNEFHFTPIDPDDLAAKVAEIVLKRLEEKIPSLTAAADRGGISLAEEVTGYTRNTIYRMTSEGKIPFHQRMPGGKLEFSRKELEEWIVAGRPDVSAERVATAAANYLVNGKKKSRSANAKRL